MTDHTESLNHCSTDLLGALGGELQPAVPVPDVAELGRDLPLADAACPCDQRAAAPLVVEARFTLGEAAVELASRTCAAEGHDLEIVSASTGGSPVHPIALVCMRGCSSHGFRVLPMRALDVSYAELLTDALTDLWADLAAAYERSTADPRESTIECAGLITRIVGIARVIGAVPAELVGPELVVDGLYTEVHRLAGREATIADCTMAAAREHLAERAPVEILDEGPVDELALQAAPCRKLIAIEPHGSHTWTAPNDGPVWCPGLSDGSNPVMQYSSNAVDTD